MKLFLTFALLLASANAYFIFVDANEEQCFFERATSGAKLSLTFEVADGGFLDIDVKIVGPDNRQIYKGDRESSGKYNFAAHMDGAYTFCFGNLMSTMTPKTLLFSIETSEPRIQVTEKPENPENHKLEEMVQQLSGTLTSVKHEQEYMEIRERVHRKINENTNSRVVYWAVFETAVLVSMTLGQIWYLKRFFEVRSFV
ncbi:unnamed protein product, partial [Mesorhabditis belari]|uniref:GOLD domain-containing protein n=1 Tax=Mesorhabditis belari TaxID=2138241 RepID=A0AAF3FDG0_9BILA